MAAAVLIVAFPENMAAGDNAIIVLNHLVTELAFYATLAACLSTVAIGRRYLQAKTYIDRAASIVLGSLGLRLFVSR